MGKGIFPDSHDSNTASARSMVLNGADVVLVLGARLNCILQFGKAPKWNSDVEITQVVISAEGLGKNNADPSLGIVGDINAVTSQLSEALGSQQYDTASAYMKALQASTTKNESTAAKAAKVDKSPMVYGRSVRCHKEDSSQIVTARRRQRGLP